MRAETKNSVPKYRKVLKMEMWSEHMSSLTCDVKWLNIVKWACKRDFSDDVAYASFSRNLSLTFNYIFVIIGLLHCLP